MKRTIRHSKIAVVTAILITPFIFANFGDKRTDCSRGAEDLSVFEGDLFSASGKCVMCHNTDSSGAVLVDEFGNDVSMVNDWMATMMANSARDPFWKAKVEHEGIVNPDHQNLLESTCTKCHAPMGHYEALHQGETEFTMADLSTSELGQDGVGCVACHKITEDSPGGQFSGIIDFNNQNYIYGPFADPWGGPMVAQTGMSPVHSEHTRKSELCASCHTLITQTVDLDGEHTGNHFVEQATYHEWLNSRYNEEGTECQTCHMPEVPGGVINANQPNWLFHQTPFGKHHFVGANTFMLGLMKEYREVLGLPATESQFDMVEERTRALLQEQTATVDIVSTAISDDTLSVNVMITNHAGHKFPSGYPARIAWVEIIASTDLGDTLFHSGVMNHQGRIEGRDEPYEPHHQVLDDENKVQIYEMVMGDVEGNATTVLERAEAPLKDNRLVPQGFSATHETYDTTLLAGLVLSDLDFNAGNAGQDEFTIKIPFEGYTGLLVTDVKLNYHSVPARWLDEMFSESGDEIDSFRAMFDATPKVPELVTEARVVRNVYSEPDQPTAWAVPNPSPDGVIDLWYEGEPIDIVGYNAIGQSVYIDYDPTVFPLRVYLPEASGMYYLNLRFDDKEEVVKVLKIRP